MTSLSHVEKEEYLECLHEKTANYMSIDLKTINWSDPKNYATSSMFMFLTATFDDKGLIYNDAFSEKMRISHQKEQCGYSTIDDEEKIEQHPLGVLHWNITKCKQNHYRLILICHGCERPFKTKWIKPQRNLVQRCPQCNENNALRIWDWKIDFSNANIVKLYGEWRQVGLRDKNEKSKFGFGL